MDSFSKRLKDYISERGWKIKSVSKKTGIPEATIYAWTGGSRVPPDYIQDLIFYRLDGMR